MIGRVIRGELWAFKFELVGFLAAEVEGEAFELISDKVGGLRLVKECVQRMDEAMQQGVWDDAKFEAGYLCGFLEHYYMSCANAVGEYGSNAGENKEALLRASITAMQKRLKALDQYFEDIWPEEAGL